MGRAREDVGLTRRPGKWRSARSHPCARRFHVLSDTLDEARRFFGRRGHPGPARRRSGSATRLCSPKNLDGVATDRRHASQAYSGREKLPLISMTRRFAITRGCSIGTCPAAAQNCRRSSPPSLTTVARSPEFIEHFSTRRARTKRAIRHRIVRSAAYSGIACGSGRSMRSLSSAKESDGSLSQERYARATHGGRALRCAPRCMGISLRFYGGASLLPVTMTPPAAPLRVVSSCGPRRGASTQEWFRRYALDFNSDLRATSACALRTRVAAVLDSVHSVSTRRSFFGSRLRR